MTELSQQVNALKDSNKKLREALTRITQEGGRVCSEFEICAHESCRSSSAAYLIAIEALNQDNAPAEAQS